MISWCDPDLIPKEEWDRDYAEPIMAGRFEMRAGERVCCACVEWPG